MEAMMERNQWIVAAVDGSAAAERGLQWAIDEARLRGASVRVVTAWHVPVGALPGLLTNSVAVQCALHAPVPTVIVR